MTASATAAPPPVPVPVPGPDAAVLLAEFCAQTLAGLRALSSGPTRWFDRMESRP